MCEDGECDCPRRSEDEQMKQNLKAAGTVDSGLSEMVYSTLLYGGSPVARELTEGAGKDTVRLFVQQIIRTYKAIQC